MSSIETALSFAPVRLRSSCARRRTERSAATSVFGVRNDSSTTSRTRVHRSIGRSEGLPVSTSRSSRRLAKTAAGQPSGPSPTAATIAASRGCRGSFNIARPSAVSFRSSSTAPNSSNTAKASSTAPVDGWSRRRSSDGVDTPHANASSRTEARSMRVISADSCADRAACSILDHRRNATPGPSRPARPAR